LGAVMAAAMPAVPNPTTTSTDDATTSSPAADTISFPPVR
jgi:hypothetical protein